MLALTCLAVVIALGVIIVGGSSAGPLDPVERIYLGVAPIPAVLALVLPGPISQLMQGSENPRTWALWLNVAGGWLSLALLLAGALLLARRWGRRPVWDRRLLAGLMVAGLPAALIAVVALMYAL